VKRGRAGRCSGILGRRPRIIKREEDIAVADQTDPLAMWREWLSQSERQWNTFFNESMSTPQYSQNVGRFMELYVAAQRQLGETMGRHLAALNVPTRADVLGLGERLVGLETRLARIEAALARLTPEGAAAASAGGASSPVERPPRTKRPPDAPAEAGA
jgi:hypothetical protein